MTRHAHWWEEQGDSLVCAQCSTGIPLIEFNAIPPSAIPVLCPQRNRSGCLLKLWPCGQRGGSTRLPTCPP